jgi:ABC-type antimicrobial peptide transport system permease subunit
MASNSDIVVDLTLEVQMKKQNNRGSCITNHVMLGFCGVILTILFIVLGSISLGESVERTYWNPSLCSVLNVQNILVPATMNSRSHNSDVWNVIYFNTIAQANINATIQIFDESDQVLQALRQVYFPSSTSHPCVFRNDTFLVQWTLPTPEYKAVGYSAIAFGIALIFVIILTIISSILWRYGNILCKWCQACEW